MMESIASMAMGMSAASFATNYSLSVTKKMMDSQELAGQELLKMLEAVPRPRATISTSTRESVRAGPSGDRRFFCERRGPAD